MWWPISVEGRRADAALRELVLTALAHPYSRLPMHRLSGSRRGPEWGTSVPPTRDTGTGGCRCKTVMLSLYPVRRDVDVEWGTGVYGRPAAGAWCSSAIPFRSRTRTRWRKTFSPAARQETIPRPGGTARGAPLRPRRNYSAPDGMRRRPVELRAFSRNCSQIVALFSERKRVRGGILSRGLFGGYGELPD